MADNGEAASTVKWQGDLLADSAASSKDDLLKAFSSADRILLDLSECSQIDVPVIQLILAASIEAANKGKKFSLTEDIPLEIKRAFELAGVNIANFTA